LNDVQTTGKRNKTKVSARALNVGTLHKINRKI